MKIFYKPRHGDDKHKQIPLDKEAYAAHIIAEKIRFQEGIDHSLRLTLYDNKTGHIYREDEMIEKLSYLEYSTQPLTN